MEIILSVIIPVYNTGEYLRRCIESVLNQSFKNIEVILINDGSTDNSGDICDEYSINDSRVKVIHKENEGVSIARNIGLDKAKGQYIGFVDSDDWLDRDMYQSMINNAYSNKADIVICDSNTIYDKKRRVIDTISLLNKSKSIDSCSISKELLLNLAGSVWRGIYKKKLINDNNIRFPEGLKLSEDRVFNILAIGYSNSIYYDKVCRYNRLVRNGSAINSYHEDFLSVLIGARYHIRKAIDEAWQGQNELKNAYERQTVSFALIAIYNEFHKGNLSSFSSKYYNIKRICSSNELQAAVKNSEGSDFKKWLISKKQILLLCIVSIFFNIKNRR